ncbi:enoyl-CoA hydratase/isomerase family protein [Kutzneria kofuensis]|uniref:Enoyl-CoA hydratase/carnithine racemase n=1 Tax=Kutzneria kofuensis TaxID=103725 RepID=A0A7W9NEI9_9PSEU|nr:enoyl-CoA hydratase/isomerase family protein [Kutzneria kofuensis]MBB5889715.1 enoyl-CoA hydratase/carnithine racemase [Kutzneria kofuensis]
MSANVLVRGQGRSAEVVLGSGGSANALGHDDWRALETAFRQFARDEDIRVIVVRGSGSTFSAGSDLREWVHAAPDDVDRAFAAMEAACTAIEECPTPVIAQVSGVAAGAGCQLALACDLRVFADDARIGMPIARLGILVSPAFAARLALLAGHGLARELLYTGRLLDAAEAVAAGLANRRVPSAELSGATAELVAAVAAQPRAALVAAKQAVSVGLSPTRAAADSFASGPAVSYEDFQRGVTAFLSRSRHH